MAISCLLASSLLAVSWSIAAPSPEWSIYPGRGIGHTRLGLISSRYRLFLDQGVIRHEVTGDTAMGRTWYVWRGKTGHELGVYTVRGAGDSAARRIDYVEIVRITSPSFRTTEGLRVGSTLDAIRKRYRLSEVMARHGLVKTFDSTRSGIAFEVASGVCTAILVHPKNQPPFPIYHSYPH